MTFVRRKLLNYSWLLLFSTYFAIALLITWPLVTHLSTYLPDGTDSLVHYWNGWWSRQAIQAGQLPYYTSYLFYPGGLSMVYHNFAWVHILLWIVLRPFTGDIAAYNLTLLINLTLCGVASFWLACEVTQDRRAALLAGLIYESWPYRLTQPSHPNMMSTWAIPIFILFLIRVVKNKRRQDGVGAGIALALVGYMRWQLLIPATLMGGLYLLLTLYNQLTFSHLRILLLTAAMAAILLLPPVLLLASEWQQNPADLVLEGEERLMQTDVLAYVTPPGSHFLLGAVTESVYGRYYADRGSRSSFSPYIGVLVLFLVGMGVWKNGRRVTLPWSAMALMLVLLALGPTLRINGQQFTSIPMPYNWLDAVIPIRLLREPDRFNMFLALPVSVLAAFGITTVLSSRQWRHWQQPILLLGLSGVILFEYLTTPLSLQSVTVSAFYTELAKDPAEFAILNIPVDPFKSKPYMFAQTIHHHPILQGHASRYPQGTFEYLESQPWVYRMLQFSDMPPKQKDISHQMAALAADGVGYIIIHKALIPKNQLAYWKEYFVMRPTFEDEAMVVYTTQPSFGRDFSFIEEVVSGLGVIRIHSGAACVHQGDLLEVDIAWGSNKLVSQDFGVKLVLVAADGSEVGLPPTEMPQLPASSWQSGTIIWEYYDVVVPSGVAEGAYHVEMTLVDLETGVVQSRLVRVQETAVQAGSCFEDGFEGGETAVNASFGNILYLSGYRLQHDDTTMTLTLYWQARHRLAVDYKVFVHIFDPATGIPLAQDDAMPRRWAYPTTFWQPGEIVEDTIAISIESLPAGEYGVAVGVYHPDTGERLKVRDGQQILQQDGRLTLGPLIRLK